MKYAVNIDLKFSQDFEVEATSEADAKRKALEKFKRDTPKKDFSFAVEMIVPKNTGQN